VIVALLMGNISTIRRS